MTKSEFDLLSPFEQALLDELRQLRRVIERLKDD